MTYRFVCEDPHGRRVEIATEATTWRDLTAVYVDFLRGCGFVIDYKHGGVDDLIAAAEG